MRAGSMATLHRESELLVHPLFRVFDPLIGLDSYSYLVNGVLCAVVQVVGGDTC